jgi:L-galactose dehydrogenase
MQHASSIIMLQQSTKESRCKHPILSPPLLQLTMSKIPRRPFASSDPNGEQNKLAKELSIVGLGCSSFSSFFDSESASIDLATLDKQHPVVQEWIQTIHFAILEAGINLLDTAPWYGHGTSEMVVGWALEELFHRTEEDAARTVRRQDLIVNTKVGRYEANPSEQFDFSYSMTIKSAKRSMERLKCDFIDTLQLHDPEFAPSLKQLLEETIPAMRECQEKGYCRALGLTGYPLQVQYQILQASIEHFGTNVWDQSLTYGHFNLHDSSLLRQPMSLFQDNNDTIDDDDNDSSSFSFANVLRNKYNMGVLAAAPLSMGILTSDGPPEWHPAGKELQQACRRATEICDEFNVDISSLAILYALSHCQIPCTILGMKNIAQVKAAATLAQRFATIESNAGQDQNVVLKSVLSSAEYSAYEKIIHSETGPFAQQDHWSWDGIESADDFWKELGVQVEHWQERQL